MWTDVCKVHLGIERRVAVANKLGLGQTPVGTKSQLFRAPPWTTPLKEHLGSEKTLAVADNLIVTLPTYWAGRCPPTLSTKKTKRIDGEPANCKISTDKLLMWIKFLFWAFSKKKGHNNAMSNLLPESLWSLFF